MSGQIFVAMTAAAAVASLTWYPASAGGYKPSSLTAQRFERDCTPINGPYGYYGNPWCDTGSYRPPDIEFRERQRQLNRWRPSR